MIKHRAYPAAAKDHFPYAWFVGGDGQYCVVCRCAIYYQRGYTRDWWRKWRVELFKTEADATTNMRQPCQSCENEDGLPTVLCSLKNHFLFMLALAKDFKKPEPKIEPVVPPVEPDRQGSLF